MQLQRVVHPNRKPEIVSACTYIRFCPTYHKAFEAQLCLEHTIEKGRILATIAVVNSLIRTHQRSCSLSKRVHERPRVELVQCAVIDIGRHSFTLRSGSSPVLLFLRKPMLAEMSARAGANYQSSLTFGVAITPSSCVPRVSKAPPTPARYGSAPRPSQLRPPRTTRPIGPMNGPSAT